MTTPTAPGISAAQHAANRTNAQKSTGPQSESGKQRCRLNAVRHGLTGQFQALSREDKAAFDRHCAGLLEDIRPAGAREQVLAISIAEDHWRLHRARALENNIFAIGMSTEIADATDADSPEVHAAVCQARVWLQDARHLQLLTLYEARIRRTIEKNEKQLAHLQSTRRAAEAEALEQAKQLARLARSQGQSAPEADLATVHGFVFSAAEIDRLLAREDRVRQARALFAPGWRLRRRPSPAASGAVKAA